MHRDKAVFRASWPANGAGIKHDQEGGTLRLDFDETQVAEVAKLLLWKERLLKVTVGPE